MATVKVKEARPLSAFNASFGGAYKSKLCTAGDLAAENDEGSVEYKWRLTQISSQRFEHLVTQMKFRVAEGNGQCMYEIGVADNGCTRGLNECDFAESILTVRRMAEKLKLDVAVAFERVVQTEPEVLKCAELIVTKRVNSNLVDLRCAFCGSTASGKSTLVSVLVNGTLDDGNGGVRQDVFNHKHEVDSGRTSSLSHRVLGFDETGRITNYDESETTTSLTVCPGQYASLCHAENGTRTIAERSVKLVTLMDLGGDEKFAKTAIFGMTSRLPGYACICIGADQRVNEAVQYVQLCHAMRIPFFVVVTKVDRFDSDFELDDFVYELSAVLSSCDVETTVLNGDSDATSVELAAKEYSKFDASDGRVSAAVLLVSSVSGLGLTTLKQFLRQLPVPLMPCSGPAEVLVDGSFAVADVGSVLTGFVSRGTVRVGMPLLLGPDRVGAFHAVTVSGIHVKGHHVTRVAAGSDATFAIGTLPPSVDMSRKGKVLVDATCVPNVCREFELQAKMLTRDVITSQQEPILHCRNIRQAVKILWVSPEEVRYGEVANMRVRFLFNAEVLDESSVVVLRWGRHAKLIGKVAKVNPLTPASSPTVVPATPTSLCVPMSHQQACCAATEAGDGDNDVSPARTNSSTLMEETDFCETGADTSEERWRTLRKEECDCGQDDEEDEEDEEDEGASMARVATGAFDDDTLHHQ